MLKFQVSNMIDILSYKEIIVEYLKNNDLFFVEAVSGTDSYRVYFRFPFVPELDLMYGTIDNCNFECKKLQQQAINYFHNLL